MHMIVYYILLSYIILYLSRKDCASSVGKVALHKMKLVGETFVWGSYNSCLEGLVFYFSRRVVWVAWQHLMSPTSQKQHLGVSTSHLDKLPNLHDVSHMIGHSWYIIDDVSYTIDHQWPIIHDIYITSYLVYHIWFSWMILHVRCIECIHHICNIICDTSNVMHQIRYMYII